MAACADAALRGLGALERAEIGDDVVDLAGAEDVRRHGRVGGDETLCEPDLKIVEGAFLNDVAKGRGGGKRAGAGGVDRMATGAADEGDGPSP